MGEFTLEEIRAAREWCDGLAPTPKECAKLIIDLLVHAHEDGMSLDDRVVAHFALNDLRRRYPQNVGVRNRGKADGNTTRCEHGPFINARTGVWCVQCALFLKEPTRAKAMQHAAAGLTGRVSGSC